jgi:hypothetical protein
MADGSSIGAAMYVPTIFECPNCKETIDTSAETCRFCGVKVDHEAALRAAVVMAKVNQACSDAKYMRHVALSLPVFFVFYFLPVLHSFGMIGFPVITLITPFWALRWWLMYGNIETDDAEFRQARKRVKWIGIIVGCVLVLSVTVIVAAKLLLYLYPTPS